MRAPYDSLIDPDLEQREFDAFEDIGDPRELSMAMLRDALCRILDSYTEPDAAERSRLVAHAVQVLAAAAQVPVLAEINDLRARVEAQEAIPTLTGAIRAALGDFAPVRADRLLTREQAAELLACRPRTVGRYITAVRKGVYRWSDVRRYIETGVRQGRG